MSKILAILLIILISQFTPFITKIQAASPCLSDNPILTYRNSANGSANSQTFFAENSGDLKFTFTFTNDNVLQNILNGKQSKWLYLHFVGGWFGFGNYDTPAFEVTQGLGTFDLTISQNSDFAKRNNDPYLGSLYSADDNQHTTNNREECSGIKYRVGLNVCKFVVAPNIIAPNTNFCATFYGRANNQYSIGLLPDNNGKPDKNLPFVLAGNWQTTTSPQGEGNFTNISVNRYNSINNKYFLWIKNNNTGDDECFNPLIVSLGAPSPPDCSTAPPVPGAIIVTPGGPPTVAGGENCDQTGGRGYAIKTAIGCIHTSPAEFTKDFLTFIIGISGGLAFLMMLLGAFQMLTSAGNPETLSAGRERLTSAIIGLLFVIFAVLLLQIIGYGILNITGFKP